MCLCANVVGSESVWTIQITDICSQSKNVQQQSDILEALSTADGQSAKIIYAAEWISFPKEGWPPCQTSIDPKLELSFGM